MNMKQVALLGVIAVSGCAVVGNGDIISEDRPVEGPIRAIVVKGSVKVTVNPAPEQGRDAVQLRGDSNLLPYITAEQDEDGALTIRTPVMDLVGTAWVFVSTTGHVTSLSAQRASQVKFNDYESQKNVTIRLDGASSLRGSLRAPHAEIHANGASPVDLDVRLIGVEVNARGASPVQLRGRYDRITIEARGASRITAQAGVKKSEIHAFGASPVRVAGRCDTVTIDANGASAVDIEGNLDSVTIHATGASPVDLRSGSVNHAFVDAAGASKILLPEVEKLEVGDVRGASTVTYKGSPTVTLGSVTGASTVKRKN